MYIYLIPFQYDKNIILLPSEKSPKKAKKLSGLIVPKKNRFTHKKTFHYIPLQKNFKASSTGSKIIIAWTFDCEGKTFLTFLDIFL